MGSDYKTDEERITAYVEHFHSLVRPRYARQAKKLVPPLVRYSKRYNVDPLEPACLFSLESSWRNFYGALGERGPGQVMPNKWVSNFNLDTLEGQIHASVFIWKKALDKCGSLRRALTYYACGSCTSHNARTVSKIRYREHYIRRMKQKFGSRK
jgi:hypothetical protein